MCAPRGAVQYIPPPLGWDSCYRNVGDAKKVEPTSAKSQPCHDVAITTIFGLRAKEHGGIRDPVTPNLRVRPCGLAEVDSAKSFLPCRQLPRHPGVLQMFELVGTAYLTSMRVSIYWSVSIKSTITSNIAQTYRESLGLD